MELEEYLRELISLTIKRETGLIEQTLRSLPMSIKGLVFEEYLKKLLDSNGWIAFKSGGKNDYGADILLYHPKTPDQVSIIVQCKNQERPLSYDDTLLELKKFEAKTIHKYNCSNYILISISGFVSESEKLKEFNMRLESWGFVQSLIHNYDINRREYPEIHLFAHNQIAYEASKLLFTKINKVAIVQATGTGKSYIIIKYLNDFLNRKCMVLAPSKYILEQLKSKILWVSQSTVFMTYAKLKNLSLEEISSMEIEFIVLDEFHRCGSEHWGNGVKRILDCFPNSLILGTSATPIRYLDNNRDMSDELFEGNVSANLNLSEAIVKRILPMPMYISALYTLDEEFENIRNRINNSCISDKGNIENEIITFKKNWEKSKGIPQILKKYINSDHIKFIVFCENKDHLNDMEWLVEMWFKKSKAIDKIKKYRVTSGDPNNDKELESFANSKEKRIIHLLFAIDMLNEGLHIQNVSGVILLRDTRSPRIFYQQIGRVIQAGNSNNIPIIFDFVNNFSNICASDFLSELNIAKENELNKRKSLGLDENCPQFSIIDETKEEVDFFRQIESKINNIWEYRFEELKQFKEKFGICHVTKSQPQYSSLMQWIKQQRRDCSKGLLPIEKITKLNSIEFIWDIKDYFWYIMFQKYKEYVTKYGSHVIKLDCFENRKLSAWVVTQRKFRKNGLMNDVRINKLDEMGFDWSPDLNTWLNHFIELSRYVEVHGDSNVYKYYTSNGLNLGEWVKKQRNLFKLGKLDKYRIDKLDSINFEYDQFEASWNIYYERLKQYKIENGNCNVARYEQYKIENGDCNAAKNDTKYDNLGLWVSHQRRFYKAGKLQQHRIDKLKEIGFEFQGIIGAGSHKNFVKRRNTKRLNNHSIN